MSIDVAFRPDRRVAFLTINRPEKLNALSIAVLRELIDACRALDREPDLRAVVVRGAGDRAFSAGFDLGDLASGDPSGAQLGFEATDALDRLRAVTIAAIHGHCVGGGVVLASACDLRIASSSARFVVPEVDVGIPLAWSGLPRLVRELGPAVTKELVITCRPFSAAEAHGWRFVNEVLPSSDVDARATALAEAVAAKPRQAVATTKQQVRIATEQMVATHTSDLDRTLIAAAVNDAESRATMRAYIGG